MCSLITLVNVNHVDNYLKEILAFLYYGLILNNHPKNAKSKKLKKKKKKVNDLYICSKVLKFKTFFPYILV